MQQSSQTAEQTFTDIMLWRPALKNFLTVFSPLFMAMDKLSNEMVTNFDLFALPACQPERMQNGISILADFNFPDLAQPLAHISAQLSGQLQALPNLQGNVDPYQKYFAQVHLSEQAILWRSIVTNDANILQELAEKLNLDAAILHFLAKFFFSVLLKALVTKTYGAYDISKEWPWDTNNVWQQGYCPVCGAYPTIGWLDKPTIDERNTYLLEGGGRKHLHCGLCGANWRFLRLSCPNCGINESKELEMLTCTDNTHGESLDHCSKCNSYYPLVDLRERINIPHLDAQALGMLHLDLIAHEKGLMPLRLSFWNSFN